MEGLICVELVQKEPRDKSGDFAAFFAGAWCSLQAFPCGVWA